MILGLGIDLVEVARIRSSVARFGDRFVLRILRPEEASYCGSHPDPALHVAARFAAKEAVSKALGTGIGLEIGWHDIEVGRLVSGAPWVQLHGKGAELAKARGITSLHLSLTHTANTAAAVAVLEG
jgi:holo-[acyl-carrier protein] synthase